MSRFILKCVVFSLPVIAVFAFPFSVFYFTGEFLSPDSIIRKQNENSGDLLYQSAFTSVIEKSYKALATITKNPEIIALGKSRVLTFRSYFFKNPNTFYNAGRGVHNSADLSLYLDQIPKDSKLKIVLFDLSGFLKDDPIVDDSTYDSNSYNMVNIFLTSGWRQAYIYYLQKKFSLSDIFNNKNSNAIGLGALILKEGFRSDGSLSRGDDSKIRELKNQLSLDISNFTSSSTPWIGNYGYDTSFDQKNLDDIDEFLGLAKERNIYVIGYFSPYAKEIYERMKSLKDSYGESFRNAPSILNNVFAKYNYHFYDLRDLQKIGSSDAELYDVTHTTEKGTLRLLDYLAIRESELRGHVDIYSINKKISDEKY